MRTRVYASELFAVLFGFGALMLLIVGGARIAMQVHQWVTDDVWEPDPLILLIGPIRTGHQSLDALLTSIASWVSTGSVLLLGAIILGRVTLRFADLADSADGYERQVRRVSGRD